MLRDSEVTSLLTAKRYLEIAETGGKIAQLAEARQFEVTELRGTSADLHRRHQGILR
jgi:hypothetical protein